MRMARRIVAMLALGLCLGGTASCTQEARDNFLSWINGDVGGTGSTSQSSGGGLPAGEWPNPFLQVSSYPAYATVLPRTECRVGDGTYEQAFGDSAAPEVVFSDVAVLCGLDGDARIGVAVSFVKDAGALAFHPVRPTQGPLDGWDWELSDDGDVLYVWRARDYMEVPEDFRAVGTGLFNMADGSVLTTEGFDAAVISACVF